MDIVKSRLLVESIKKNMTIDEVKAVHTMDANTGDGIEMDYESNHIFVTELCEHIYNFGP